jgi:outer membrane lipoprotein-sorting protein
MKLVTFLIFTLFLNTVWAGFLPKSFEADFEQITKSLRREKKSPVKVFYKFQSNIYFEVTGDTPVTYVCNKKKVWKYNPPFIDGEAGELTVGDSSKYCYSKFFDALSKGLKNNKLYKVKKTRKEAVLTFEPKASKQLSIVEMKIQFKNDISKNTTLADVDFMNIYKLNAKKPVKLKLIKIDTKVKLSDEKFVFKAPKNTKFQNMK